MKWALRERGIYSLPDGREFVADAASPDRYFLFTLGTWEHFGLHLYETDGAGRLRSNGKLTDWRIADLTDSHRTARSRSRSGAANYSH